MLFYKALLYCGFTLSKAENSPDLIKRKANAVTSEAVHNVIKGAVRTWKNVVLGLGISAIAGSKLVV